MSASYLTVSGDSRLVNQPLLLTTHDWHKYLDEGAEVCAIFLDLKKAFDSVPHRHLLDIIMSQIGIHPVLLRWTCNFLMNRTQRVVLDGHISSDVHAISGVPQGSLLGPLLCLIYTLTVLQMTSCYANQYEQTMTLQTFRKI